MADNSNMQIEQCREIMKCHHLPMPNLTEQDLWEKLHTGVLVDGNKYFWLDKKARICVELYAKALTVTWGTNREYWTHIFEKIQNTEDWAEVGEIESLCWLDVQGEFDMRKLTPMTEYEIFFDIELKACAKGWDYPVIFEHNSPFGLMSKFEVKLDHLIGKGPALLSVGRFMLPPVPAGTASAFFRMYEHREHWKTGLVMRGVIIKAAN
ncbi:hypothetical protein V2J09_016864 [Rumex salicifolius]